MLEVRVARLEEAMDEVNSTLKNVEHVALGIRTELKHRPSAADHTSLKADIARLDGKISSIPSMWQTLTMIITTWSAGAAIVFTLLRLSR